MVGYGDAHLSNNYSVFLIFQKCITWILQDVCLKYGLELCVRLNVALRLFDFDWDFVNALQCWSNLFPGQLSPLPEIPSNRIQKALTIYHEQEMDKMFNVQQQLHFSQNNENKYLPQIFVAEPR